MSTFRMILLVIFGLIVTFFIWAFGFINKIGAAELYHPKNWPPCQIVIINERNAVAIDWACVELWAADGHPLSEETDLARMLRTRRNQLTQH